MIQWIKEKEKKRGRNVGRKRIWLLPSHGFITSRIVVVVARGNERLNERNRFGPRDGWGKVAAAAKTSQREAPRNADATKPPNRVISFIWNVFFLTSLSIYWSSPSSPTVVVFVFLRFGSPVVVRAILATVAPTRRANRGEEFVFIKKTPTSFWWRLNSSGDGSFLVLVIALYLYRGACSVTVALLRVLRAVERGHWSRPACVIDGRRRASSQLLFSPPPFPIFSFFSEKNGLFPLSLSAHDKENELLLLRSSIS